MAIDELEQNVVPFEVRMDVELGEGLEELDDGSIEILSELLPDDMPDMTLEFYDNLVEILEPMELVSLNQQVDEGFEDDAGSRVEWFRSYQKALKTMSLRSTDSSSEAAEKRASLGLSAVNHPMIAEAAQNLQSRAVLEMCPKGGAVGIKTLGEDTEEKLERADRVRDMMNYQTTTQMTEYYHDTDRMLYHLGFVGHTFKKIYWDPIKKRPVSKFVTAEEVVVHDQITSDIESCQRLTHQLVLTKEEYQAHVAEGWYKELSDAALESDTETVNQTEKEIEGISPISESTDNVYLLEQHVTIYVKGDEENKSGLALPYIITTHPSTMEVVRIQRNWDPEDETQQKLEWFADYRLLPGFGYYGFGYYHLLSGLNDAATGSMRSLLDSASYANLQGGFKLKGRMKGGDMTIGAGEFKDIDSTIDDVRKAIMPLPFKEPSNAMFQMMTYLDGRGAKYAGSVETVVNDAGANTPVGTIMAIIDETGKPQSAIYRRLCEAQSKEFRILFRLNRTYIEEIFEYDAEGCSNRVRREDFAKDLKIVPTSDPENFNTTKRIMKAQLLMDMAEKYPQFHDPYKAVKRFYEAARIEDYDDVMIDPDSAVRLDAANENIAIMMGKPIKVFIDQDHMAHISVLDQWFGSLPPEYQQITQQTYMSHRAEHMAFYYRAQLQAQMQAPLPPIPEDLSVSKSEQMIELSPQMDRMITEAAAVIVNNQPPNMGPPTPMQQQAAAQQPPIDPMQAEAMKAQAEAQSVQVKTAAQIEADTAKTQNQIQLENAKAANAQQGKIAELQAKSAIDGAKAGQEMQMKEAEHALNIELQMRKHVADIEALMMKTQAQIAADQEKLESNILSKMQEMVIKGNMEATKAEADAVKQVADVLKEVDKD